MFWPIKTREQRIEDKINSFLDIGFVEGAQRVVGGEIGVLEDSVKRIERKYSDKKIPVEVTEKITGLRNQQSVYFERLAGFFKMVMKEGDYERCIQKARNLSQPYATQ